MDMDNNMGIDLESGDSGVGWKWGKVDKAGRTVTAYMIKNFKIKNIVSQ